MLGPTKGDGHQDNFMRDKGCEKEPVGMCTDARSLGVLIFKTRMSEEVFFQSNASSWFE